MLLFVFLIATPKPWFIKNVQVYSIDDY